VAYWDSSLSLRLIRREEGAAVPSRHVVPNPDGGWDVKEPNNPDPTSHHRTQGEAEGAAKGEVRREGGGEVVIHDRHGRIRDKDTVAPGSDPNPPRDRRH
jgi:hypothetical protein